MIHCLSYEQLKAYSEHQLSSSENEQLYKHISSCEMCACAVNGFSAHPYTSDDLVAIHREIDARTQAAKPLTFAQVAIAAISLASIFAVYHFSNTIEEKPAIPAIAGHFVTSVKRISHETKSESQKEISAVVKTFKKVLTQKQTEKFVEKITAPEFIAPVSPVSYVLETPISAVEDETALLPKYNSDVIYIYDLKVTDYNGLYFARLQNDKNPFHTHVPVFKENREDENELIEETHILPADRVLKDGLEAFNKQHYRNALEHFNLLLENNPEDINAQFYAALSYYNENKFERSQSLLEKLLGNKNNTFFQEAQWYSALNDLKLGNKEKAKQQLEQISNEKGFYAKKAKIKLRNL